MYSTTENRFLAAVGQLYSEGIGRGAGMIARTPLEALRRTIRRRRLNAELAGLHPDQARDAGIDPRSLPPRYGEPDLLALQAIGWNLIDSAERLADDSHRQRR